MGDKEQASEESTVITDEMLSSAADAVTETEEVETEEVEEAAEETEDTEETEEVAEETDETEESEATEEVPAEPEDPSIRSGLGRKVKRQEQTIATLMQRLEQLESKPAAAEEEDDIDPEDFIKKKDLPKLFEQRDTAKVEKRTAYETSYLSKVVEIGNNKEINDGLQDEIAEEMQANYNKIITGDPASDATQNFNSAHVAVLERRLEEDGKPKNPLKGGKSKVATGVGGGGPESKEKPAVAAVKLDVHAAELVKEMGLSPDKAAEILAKEDKPHLNLNRR